VNWILKKIFTIFFAAALCISLAHYTVDHIKKNNQVESHSRELDLFYSVFTNHFFHRIDIVQRIAEDINVISAAAGVVAADDPKVLAVLDAVKSTADVSLCYIINSDGNVVASTTYDGGRRLTGNNYSFRPYFERAMSGDTCVYPALGVTTNKFGVYISTPIFSQIDGRAVGVVVFKVPIDKINVILNDYRNLCLLVSPQNVVFASNDDSYLLSSVGELSKSDLSEIRQSRQFGNAEIKRLPFSSESGRAVIDGREYGVLTRKIDEAGWGVLSYYDIELAEGISTLQLVFVTLSSSVLFIMIILLASLLINMRMDWHLLYRKLRIKIFVPTAISLLVLIGGATFVILWSSQEHFVRQAVKMTDKLDGIIDSELNESSELMIGMIEVIKQNRDVVEAWKTKNREMLYDTTKGFLKEISSNYKISHLYFHQPDMINFLRVHNPDKFGKLSKRALVSETEVVKGLQIGTHGVCSLRVIVPWKIDQKLVGYVEMASELIHHLPHIQANFEDKLILTIRKDLLDKELWLEGDGFRHSAEEWGFADEFVVVYPQGDKALSKVVDAAEHSKGGVRFFDINLDDKRLVGGGVSIYDVVGNSIGTLFVYSDVSAMVIQSWQVAMSLVVGVISASWLIFTFYWFFLGRIEKRIVETHDSLEAEIAERVKVENELVEAKEEAVLATHAKSDFLAKMTHEIRTPMNGVLGMLEILHKTKMTKTQKHYAEIAQKSAKGLVAIINDILDFSKIEAGKLTLTDETFCLRELFVDTGGMLSFIASEKDLDLILKVQRDLPAQVISDPLRLKQILINLIGNAIKFTERGHVKVSVSCRTIAGDHVELHFSVEDTGDGISEEEQNDLFTEFTQVDSVSTRKGGGTGLGLAISKQLVELMGGEISLSSTVGIGTIFSFTIPVLLPEEGQFETNRESGTLDDGYEKIVLRSDNISAFDDGDEIVEPKVSSTRLPVSILLVDDNVVNQKVATILFEDVGCKVTCASNGAKAVKDVFDGNYDIVFMDGNMPVMDGFEATKTIRAHEEKMRHAYDAETCDYRPIPIVALSALASDGMERFMKAGADGFVSKPLNQKSIVDAIIKFCDLSAISGVVLPDGTSAEEPPGRRDAEEKAILNRNFLLDTAGDNIEVRRSIVDSFITDGATCIDTLVDELRGSGDTTVISKTAHALKGMLGYVGGERLEKIAADLQESATRDDFVIDTDLIEMLIVGFEELKNELEAFCLE